MVEMTAVEWLENKLPSLFEHDDNDFYKKLFEQAKEMEKQQMKDVLFEKTLRPFKFDFEHYYNETSGKD